jgi:hypothetical protein
MTKLMIIQYLISPLSGLEPNGESIFETRIWCGRAVQLFSQSTKMDRLRAEAGRVSDDAAANVTPETYPPTVSDVVTHNYRSLYNCQIGIKGRALSVLFLILYRLRHIAILSVDFWVPKWR